MNEIGIFRPVELNINVKCDPQLLDYIIKELIDTEENYVHFLSMVVDG